MMTCHTVSDSLRNSILQKLTYLSFNNEFQFVIPASLDQTCIAESMQVFVLI